MSTVGDGLYQYGGVPVPVSFTGKAWFVKPATGSDGNSGRSPVRAFKTLAKALTVGAFGDVVYLIAEANTAASTTDYQSTSLVWNVDGLHLIGVNAGGMIGQRSRIAQLSSVKDIAKLVSVTANNCLIKNVEIYQGVASGTSAVSMALGVSGTRNVFENCQISGIGDSSMDDAGARSLFINGSENTFRHCYIGLDTVIRGTALCEVEILGTAGSEIARTVFEDCMISSWTSLSTFKAVKATYIDRFAMFKNCVFQAAQNASGAVAPTGAILNTTPNGNIVFHGSAVYGYADVSTLADSSTVVSSFPANAANAGVGGAATPS